MASDGCFEIAFLTAWEDGTWTVTGLVDEMDGRLDRIGKSRVEMQCLDEELGAILEAHKSALARRKEKPSPPPETVGQAVSTLARFLSAAFD
ncbi:MAG: hypothetical protein ACRENB_04260 [Gemmatimonadales bacterium]